MTREKKIGRGKEKGGERKVVERKKVRERERERERESEEERGNYFIC